jgi:hypothetical protein
MLEHWQQEPDSMLEHWQLIHWSPRRNQNFQVAGHNLKIVPGDASITHRGKHRPDTAPDTANLTGSSTERPGHDLH